MRDDLTRSITSHHDGHGLNDSIVLTSDLPDESGAAHAYQAKLGDDQILGVQFQQGPRLDPASTPGCTELVLLTILIDRLEGFQAGPYACFDNTQALGHLRRAGMAMRERANERARRGVLGKNEP